MRLHFALALCMASLAMASCKNESSTASREIHYTLDDFAQVTMHPAERYDLGALSLSRPTELRIADGGSLLIVDRKRRDGCLIKYDPRTDGFGSAVPVGRASGEALSPSSLCVRNGEIWLSSLMDSKVLVLNDSLTLLEEYVLNPGFYKALPLSDSTLLVLSEQTSGNRMETRLLDGTALDTLGSFPILKDSPNTVLNNAFMQADYTISPNTRHVAIACHTYEYLDIYDSLGNLENRLTGPKDILQRAEMTKHDYGYTFDQPDASAVYQNIVCDDNGFMVGYLGVSSSDPEYYDATIKLILTFDWNGNTLKAYDPGVPVKSFDVNWSSGELYCLVMGDSEPYVLKYEL